MHTIFALLGLIFLTISQFQYFATQFKIMIYVALTFRGKFCILSYEKENCLNLEICDEFICEFICQLTFLSYLIIGIVVFSMTLNILIDWINSKICENTLKVLNVIDAIITFQPAAISTFIFISYLIFPFIYVEWNFQIQLGLLLMACSFCFIFSFYWLLTRTVKKRKIKQNHGKQFAVSTNDQV